MKANLKSMLQNSRTPAAKPRPERAPVQPAVHVNSDERPHRAKTRLLGAHVAPELYISVRKIAAERGVTMLEVVREAFDDLLMKYKGA